MTSATDELAYAADLGALGPYAERFRALHPDAEVEAWHAEIGAHPHGRLRTWLVEQLANFVSIYDAHGLTGSYPMHLLSTAQWRDLIGQGTRLLDVGAGAGYVTARAAPLFPEIVCTETSPALARRLAARGFQVHAHDLLARPLPGMRFDAIACLNVLDRTRRPRALLEHLTSLMDEQTRLLIALALPLRAHVHVAGATVSADEPLPSSEQTFEGAVQELSGALFEACGLAIERIARVPYLSRGDTRAPVYVLDDALWVLRRR